MRKVFVVLLVCMVVNAMTLRAQELKVKSATAKAVDLEWTGGAGSAVLERSSGLTFQRLGPAASGRYQDTGIDAFGVYKYRINTSGKLSNVVTVGPPSAGISDAAAAPKGSDPAKYGTATAVALDENGDPEIAFEWNDPNGDGDQSDTEIRFARWDRGSYKWVAPVRVAVTGPLQDQGVNPIALGCDRATGSLAMIAAVGDNLLYATSSDHGATWKSMSLPNSKSTPHAVALVIGSGQVCAAVNAESGATYVSGSISDPGSWKSQAIPAGGGWKLRNSTNVAIAADSMGKVALAFYEDQEDGDGHRYVFWRPDSSAPTVVNGNAPEDTPDIAMTFGNSKFAAIFAAQLDSNDADHTVWYSESADGKSWSKPARLPIDGPRSTNPPLSIASSSKGALTAAFGANSGSGPANCGAPTVSRSADGAGWTTCGLGKAAGADFGPQPVTIHVIEAPNDKAYVVWQEPADSKYAPGVLVWHER
ncbi:MAG TPA: hypothetical protein VG267_22765 [Terracidiphilus sp.]|jgi:hypothetical protein|nr:hypothetical protein [Terracidiphilus sp.]